VFVEPKVRRRARASPRGGVWRKPNPKARGDLSACLPVPLGRQTGNAQADEQEPDMRCGTLGTRGHVTAKSSIHDWGVLYKSGVYA